MSANESDGCGKKLLKKSVAKKWFIRKMTDRETLCLAIIFRIDHVLISKAVARKSGCYKGRLLG